MINKVLLIIMDGFGLNKEAKGNAISTAKTPNLDNFFKNNYFAKLGASGLDVGLPAGNMGNSEVGHLNIGAGRIVYQLNTLVDKEIKDRTFFSKKQLLDAIEHSKKNKSKLHLFGLLSDGNVHSNINHLWSLLKLCKMHGLEEVYYHVFMDGRDTLPHAGISFLKRFFEKSKEIGIGKIATISGRYYAMDRDNRWDRINKAYEVIVSGIGEEITNPLDAIEHSYKINITDEFIIPKVVMQNNKPVAIVEENDSVIFFNFRADRARQITRAFIMPDFKEFEAKKYSNLKYTVFNNYDLEFLPYYTVAFELPELKNILGKIIADKGIKQLRLAETEKYAHVTFFFNGGVEKAFEKETRILVNSPKIATYDLKPDMSAYEVTDNLLNALNGKEYPLIITNYANCDMVGHTGVFEAAVKAVETVDICLGKVVNTAQKCDYTILITADHGNADKMLDENENIFTAHSKNMVPICLINPQIPVTSLSNGILADIAPTILKLMGIEIPPEMSGKILIG